MAGTNPFPSYPLVLVEWIDAASRGIRRWMTVEDVADFEEYRCVSVGWLIAESKDYIVVAPHVSPDEDIARLSDVQGEMKIPKAAIKRRKVLLP